jgi:aspartyl-tRNA(Asn)/glutamyl-tRNA(Gln) amidotransferase subunit B
MAHSGVTQQQATAYEPVIGLEVHVELQTKTKIFCPCSTAFGAPANTQVCPICLGLPGVLPVLNRRVVEYAMRAAIALNCEIPAVSQFARKNYFYPDLPKGYQITQYERSFAYRGHLDVAAGAGEAVGRRRIRISRINIEEEAAKSFHGTLGTEAGADGSAGIPPGAAQGTGDAPEAEADFSLVDFNRSGVPLVEIVSEPDIRSPEEARAYLGTLRNLLLYTGISDCKMQEGSLRCDANVSLRPVGSKEFGNLVELKNLNSFRSVVRGLEYEIRRQTEVLQRGGRVVRETRGWDEGGGRTFSMRSKEEANDYRYFPEPDLVVLRIDEDWKRAVVAEMPDLPEARRARLVKEQGLSEYLAGVLVADPAMAGFYGRALELVGGRAVSAVTVANWVTGDLTRLANAGGRDFEQLPVGPEHLVDLLGLVAGGTISGKMAKDLLEEAWASGRLPSEIAREKGLEQVSDKSALAEVIHAVLAANPDAVQSYRAGKDKVLGFLVGQVMKATRGRANPALANKMVIEALRKPE